MIYQITAIDFDSDEKHLNDVYVGQFWEADDEDDLVDEITCASGWCINSIDYQHVLN